MRSAAGWAARSRVSECHHARPSVQDCPAASHSRAARTARTCARRARPGGWRGSRARVVVIHPGSASTTPRRAEPPGDGVPGAASPSRDLGQPVRLDAQRTGEEMGPWE